MTDSFKASQSSDPEWISEHKEIWEKKPGLRWYYETQYFIPIIKAMVEGESLELGAGPGFFTRYHKCNYVTDVNKTSDIDHTEDVHNLSFEDNSLSSVIGIDVFHHFERPATALKEIARVLRPGGRVIFLEPWAGLLGQLFYDKIHHEDCYVIEDLDGRAFRSDKDPMDGNAQIPKQYLIDNFATYGELYGLKTIEKRFFSTLGWVSTGGFQPPQSPLVATKIVTFAEKLADLTLGRHVGLKLFFVAEKTE